MTGQSGEPADFLLSSLLASSQNPQDLFSPPTLAENIPVARHTSNLKLDHEARQLLSQLKNAGSTMESSNLVKRLLQKAGTNCEINDADPYGDGDQTVVESSDSDRQILRELFSDGGDILLWLTMEFQKTTSTNSFLRNCVMGKPRAVEKELKMTPTLQGRMELLERRFTSMRLTPLVLTIAISKLPGFIQGCSGRPFEGMEHEEVVRILLQYGARPNSKDVVGKTACHYGAGSKATKDTMKLVDMCISATKTCSHVGKRVVLKGLSNDACNDMEGTLGGCISSNGRRVFYPLMEPAEEMAVKPENIFVSMEDDEQLCILDKSLRTTNLVDLQDRVGAISLHEVAMSDRRDVVKFLLKRSTKCLDIVDCSGYSPRRLLLTSFQGEHVVNDVFSAHVKTTTKKKEQKAANKEACANCGIIARDLGRQLLQCTKCLDSAYCSRKCQVSHWKKTHSKVCPDRERELGVVIGEAMPIPRGFFVGCNHYTQEEVEAWECKAPDGVHPGQTFWVKVQCEDGLDTSLLISDQTRACHLPLAVGSLGHEELVKCVSANPAFLGRKGYYRAKFNGEGQLVIFPHTSTVKKW
ncbi:ANK [Seminavis robusta]|uniref:ANK n=1 Tax=Seminavis robusta TaxID=568900 RepID=A0A9N8DVI4_9STRA|nr:ANK [Seminavis robusta]|eukprot:Sro313_g114870.1 ANK (582) ;mRNA; r:47396-49326